MTNQSIEKALAPLRDERDQLEARRAALRAELDSIAESIKTINRLLTIGGVEAPPPKASRNGKANKAMIYISDKMLDRARNSAAFQSGEPFTVQILQNELGVAEATANKAIAALRSIGELRLLGSRPVPGKPAHVKARTFQRTTSLIGEDYLAKGDS